MKQDRILSASLGITGKLESTHGQIGMALAFDRSLEEGLEGTLVAVEDKVVCTGDAGQGRGAANRENE